MLVDTMDNLVNSFEEEEDRFRIGANYFDQDSITYIRWGGEELGGWVTTDEIADMITPKHDPRIMGPYPRLTRRELQIFRIRIRVSHNIKPGLNERQY